MQLIIEADWRRISFSPKNFSLFECIVRFQSCSKLLHLNHGDLIFCVYRILAEVVFLSWLLAIQPSEAVVEVPVCLCLAHNLRMSKRCLFHSFATVTPTGDVALSLFFGLYDCWLYDCELSHNGIRCNLLHTAWVTMKIWVCGAVRPGLHTNLSTSIIRDGFYHTTSWFPFGSHIQSQSYDHRS